MANILGADRFICGGRGAGGWNPWGLVTWMGKSYMLSFTAHVLKFSCIYGCGKWSSDIPGALAICCHLSESKSSFMT